LPMTRLWVDVFLKKVREHSGPELKLGPELGLRADCQSIVPKVPEAVRGKLGVANRVLDVLVAEVVL
jgi:hypothetical protein